MNELVDTHCHVHFPDYELDADQVIADAIDAGVTRMICVGCTLADSKLGVEMAAKHRSIWASIGIHPHEAKLYVEDEKALQRLIEWSEEALAVLVQWQHRHPEKKLQLLVEETLRLDPRPTLYKGFEGQESPYRNSHAVRLYEADIHFRFVNEAQILIERIVLI